LNEGMFSTNICAGKQGATLNVTTTGWDKGGDVEAWEARKIK
jgi:hypothetical protein